MSGHKFKVGQTVSYLSGSHGRGSRKRRIQNHAMLTAAGRRLPISIECQRKVNSSGRYDGHGVRLQLTGRVVHSEAWGWGTAPTDQLSSLRHCSRPRPARTGEMMLSQADIALLKELKAAGERGRT